MPQLEIAALSLADARNAAAGGADSLELLADLPAGGLTPDLTVVRAIRDQLDELTLHVIVRPHARSFVYAPGDIQAIVDQTAAIRQTGVDGIVFGAQSPDGALDIELIKRVATAAAPLSVTVHRAIDTCRDPEAALAALVGVVPRILTSGPADSAWAGRDGLTRWIKRFGADFRFVSSGGLRAEQIPDMIATGVHELHFGGAARTDDQVDVAKVEALRGAMRSA
ncbi:MAG: copper homeostasis protein CutC [Chloroflexi bacterium]|nr:copper homeostasis protein CutC [Chloroflexota bacterium]